MSEIDASLRQLGMDYRVFRRGSPYQPESTAGMNSWIPAIQPMNVSAIWRNIAATRDVGSAVMGSCDVCRDAD
jgi:hypothetical protein